MSNGESPQNWNDTMTAGNNLYSITFRFVIKGTQISMKMQKCVTSW